MDDFLGVATCEHCGVRIKLLKKHEHFVGQTVRCPKCRELFRLALEAPTAIEEAAMKAESDSAQAQETKTRKRRTQAEIRDTVIRDIRDGFRKMHPRLVEIERQANGSEEEVRRWVLDALRFALGYTDQQISTEMRVLGNRVDIALQNDGKTVCVIECKNIRRNLTRAVRHQVAAYAATLSADWAVVTNGQIWQLMRIMPIAGCDPQIVAGVEVALLDEDGVSDEDAEQLYMMSARAIFGKDTEKWFHELACTSTQRLMNAVLSDRVISALRVELMESYKQECQQAVRLNDDTVRDLIRSALVPDDF